MEQITVVNTGKRVRHRAGHTFKPGEENTVEVAASGKRAIRATADLQIVSSDTTDGAPVTTGPVDVSNMTVRQIAAALASGELSKEYVYAQESAGKARASVLDAAAPRTEDGEPVVTKDGEGDDESPDTSTPNDGAHD